MGTCAGKGLAKVDRAKMKEKKTRVIVRGRNCMVSAGFGDCERIDASAGLVEYICAGVVRGVHSKFQYSCYDQPLREWNVSLNTGRMSS